MLGHTTEKGPILSRDFPESLARYKIIQERALEVKPGSQKDLPSHRYLIAILCPSKKPGNVRSDMDLVKYYCRDHMAQLQNAYGRGGAGYSFNVPRHDI